MFVIKKGEYLGNQHFRLKKGKHWLVNGTVGRQTMLSDQFYTMGEVLVGCELQIWLMAPSIFSNDFFADKKL